MKKKKIIISIIILLLVIYILNIIYLFRCNIYLALKEWIPKEEIKRTLGPFVILIDKESFDNFDKLDCNIFLRFNTPTERFTQVPNLKENLDKAKEEDIVADYTFSENGNVTLCFKKPFTKKEILKFCEDNGVSDYLDIEDINNRLMLKYSKFEIRPSSSLFIPIMPLAYYSLKFKNMFDDNLERVYRSCLIELPSL